MKAIPIGQDANRAPLFLGSQLRESTHMHVIGGSGKGKSKFLEWMIRQTATQMRGGYYSFESRFIRNLPIRTIKHSEAGDKTLHDNMVSLVDRIQELNKRLSATKNPNDKIQLEREIESTDRQIDQLVYKLYGLIEEEIKIVDGA